MENEKKYTIDDVLKAYEKGKEYAIKENRPPCPYCHGIGHFNQGTMYCGVCKGTGKA